MKKDSASRHASATFAFLFAREEDGLPGHRGFGGPGSPSRWHCVGCGSSEDEEGVWVLGGSSTTTTPLLDCRMCIEQSYGAQPVTGLLWWNCSCSMPIQCLPPRGVSAFLLAAGNVPAKLSATRWHLWCMGKLSGCPSLCSNPAESRTEGAGSVMGSEEGGEKARLVLQLLWVQNIGICWRTDRWTQGCGKNGNGTQQSPEKPSRCTEQDGLEHPASPACIPLQLPHTDQAHVAPSRPIWGSALQSCSGVSLPGW